MYNEGILATFIYNKFSKHEKNNNKQKCRTLLSRRN